MLAIHPNARTTPAVRAEIARSAEPTGELARRYGVSTETVRKWRKRGPAECRDRSSRPHKLPWKASEEERAVVCELRRATGFPLDDLTFVVRHFLPHLDRDNVYRILKAAGLSRRPAPAKPETPASKFKEYELGFVHVDVKHLPKLRTADGELRKRFLFVAIDRRSRSVHLAVKDDETEASAAAFLREVLAAFPFRVTHLLTDRGSCFTADGFEKLLPGARRRAPQDPALHAAHERHGRALQRPGPARGAGRHRRRPPRPRAIARGLQPSLQRPPPAGAGRALTGGGRPRALGAGPGPRQSRLPPAVRSVRPPQGDARDRARQGRLAARQLRARQHRRPGCRRPGHAAEAGRRHQGVHRRPLWPVHGAAGAGLRCSLMRARATRSRSSGSIAWVGRWPSCLRRWRC